MNLTRNRLTVKPNNYKDKLQHESTLMGAESYENCRVTCSTLMKSYITLTKRPERHRTNSFLIIGLVHYYSKSDKRMN